VGHLVQLVFVQKTKCTEFIAMDESMKKMRTFVLMLAVMLFPSVSQATTIERLTLDTMVRKADSIVIGKVNSARSFWSGNRKIILSRYIVEIQETIKGRPSRTLELTTIGGTVGNVTLHVAGMPVFEEGENAVVFVENAGSFLTVVGLNQGKFALENGEVRNTLTGLEFSDGRGGQPLRMKLGSFKDHIKVILASQP
jgi:hypothetical protein